MPTERKRLLKPTLDSGYYATVRKKRPPVALGLGLALLVGVALAILVLHRDGDAPAPATETVAEPEPAAEAATAPLGGEPEEDLVAENLRLRAELARLEEVLSASTDRSEIARLEARNRQLEEEVAQLRVMVERHREGLEEAVEELNDLRRRARTPSSTTASRAAEDDNAKWVFPRDPWAVMHRGRADVEGSVHNANQESVKGHVVLTVVDLGSNRTVAEKRVPMSIPGKTVKEYSTVISDNSILDGRRYVVKASWSPD